MEKFKAKIIDPIGLHARPASQLVMEASKFDSNICILFNKKSANFKSIIDVMSLGIKKNDEILIEVTGIDEKIAITHIKTAMKNNKLI